MTVPILTAGQLRNVLADVPADTEVIVDLGSLDEFYELRIRQLFPAVTVTPRWSETALRLAPVLVLEMGQEMTAEKALLHRVDTYLDGAR